MSVSFNANSVQMPITTGINQVKDKAEGKADKPKISTGVKVAVGTGLAALAAVGIYIATKGKGGSLEQTAKKFGFDDIEMYEFAKEGLDKISKSDSTLTYDAILKKVNKLAKKGKVKPGDELRLCSSDVANKTFRQSDIKFPENSLLMMIGEGKNTPAKYTELITYNGMADGLIDMLPKDAQYIQKITV